MTRIVVWGAFRRIAQEVVSALPDDDVLTPEDETQLGVARDAEVALGSNRSDRASAVLAAAPALRWYQSMGAGVENIVGLAPFRERRVVLTNNSGAMDVPIAEHVIAMLLEAAKRLHLYRDQQARREWTEHAQSEIRGQTLVVYGLGSIGAETARLGAALGMRVLGVRRREGAVPGVDRIYAPEDLAEAAAQADYLAVCAPLTHATRGAVSRAVLARMKPSSWVINIARGQIIDDDALVEALRAGTIGGAALDAHSVEPLPAESPYWAMPNVIITPHSSNSSPNVRARSLELFRENVRRYKAGEPLLNVVDPEAGY